MSNIKITVIDIDVCLGRYQNETNLSNLMTTRPSHMPTLSNLGNSGDRRALPLFHMNK